MTRRESGKRRSSVPPPRLLSDEDQQNLRQAQLDLLAELDRVCAELGLEYFAFYGTLLGAIRGSGFIPWDDDLDVGMLRPDYDALAAAAERVFADRFFFQDLRTDPHYGAPFAKLRLHNTTCVDRDSYGTRQHSGIFIDIFPLDVAAAHGRARFEQRALRYAGYRLLFLKKNYQLAAGASRLARVVQAIGRRVIRLVPQRAILALIDRPSRVARKQDPTAYISLPGAYPMDREIFPSDWIHPLVRVPFEDTTIPAPARSEAWLTQVYGDFRTLPPVHERVGKHSIIELEFDTSG